MMMQAKAIRWISAVMVIGMASVAAAGVVKFNFAVTLPGISAIGVPTIPVLGGPGYIKGHLNTKTGKVHAIGRGTVQNLSGSQFETEDTAAIAPFIPGTVGPYTVKLIRGEYSVSKSGNALFLGTFQAS